MTAKHFSFLSLLFFINNNAMLPWEDPSFQETKIKNEITSKTENPSHLKSLNIYPEVDNQNKKFDINNKVKFELNQPVPDYLKKFTRNPAIDHQDNNGNTCLHAAVNYYRGDEKEIKNKGNEGTIVLFLNKAANPFIENDQKRTPRQEAELIQKERKIPGLDTIIDLLKFFEELYFINFAETAKEKINNNNQ